MMSDLFIFVQEDNWALYPVPSKITLIIILTSSMSFTLQKKTQNL